MFTIYFELFTYLSFLFYICRVKNARFSAYHHNRLTRVHANAMCKLHKFWMLFSTSAQIAQIFARIVRFCLFIPFFFNFTVYFPAFSIFAEKRPCASASHDDMKRKGGGARRRRDGGIVVGATCRKRRVARDIKKRLLFAGMRPLRRLRRHLPQGGGLPRLSLWESSREAGERAISRDAEDVVPYKGYR